MELIRHPHASDDMKLSADDIKQLQGGKVISEQAMNVSMDKNTNTKTASQQTCIDDLLTFSKSMDDYFIGMFKGVPIRVNPELKGNQWHCAVSKELYEKIKLL